MVKNAQPTRLYSKAVHVGFRRSRANQYCNQSLVKIEGVKDVKDTSYYMGKRVCYVYKCEREVKGSRYRTVWGKIMASHGNSGIVRARFAKNLPPKSLGASLRVMMFPNRV